MRCAALRCAAPPNIKFQISSLLLLFIVTVNGSIALRLPCCFTFMNLSGNSLFVLLQFAFPLLLTFVPLFPHRLTVGRNEEAGGCELF